MRIIGPVLVVVVVLLVSAVLYVYLAVVRPFMHGDHGWTFMTFCDDVWITWLAFNIVYNYFMSIFTDPGAVATPALSDDEWKRYPTGGDHCHLYYFSRD